MARVKKRIFVSDFETTTRADDCRVWLWGLMDIRETEKYEYGTSIESFIDAISQCDSICYFHNLRFDGMFILSHLLTHGYEYSENNLDSKEFKALISRSNKFYSITVKWENGKQTEFRDSLKKLPMSVAGIAETFKLDTPKLDLDYGLDRPVDHIPTEQELKYLEHDLLIVAIGVKEFVDSGMNKLTVGADSLHEFKTLFGQKRFKRLFPVLPTLIDKEIRSAYRGGFTYTDKRFVKKVQGSGLVFDVNSLYPFIMYSREMPYGMPRWCDDITEVKENELYIASITFTARLKKDHIPCIQLKKSSFFSNAEYVTNIDEPITQSVTNVDLDLYMRQYDIDIISVNGVWAFKKVGGLFKEFIDKWSQIKENSTGGKRALAKLHLNSLYGKFATNPDVTGKVPTLIDGIVKLELGEDNEREPVYTALGVFITAYARDLTISAAQAVYPVFAYADTDSLHLLTDEVPETLDVHPTRLGAWKLEYAFDEALYMRAKAYSERLTPHWQTIKLKEYETHIAGLPTKVTDNLSIDRLKPGTKFDGKLVPKTVPGGVILEDVGYELNY